MSNRKSPSSDYTSVLMRKVHSIDTSPEIMLAQALSRKGLVYEQAPKDVVGKPDFVFRAQKIAVFVDGDFWHGNQWRKRNLLMLENQFGKTRTKDYWLKKIRGNVERDSHTTAKLIHDGWIIVRFWESQVLHEVEECAEMVLQIEQGHINTSLYTNLASRAVAEFFAGIGLMRMGLEKQGWRVLYANDIDAQKEMMYKGHFLENEAHFKLGDIHSIPVDEIPSLSLATASFPCNDLSLAGYRQGLHGPESSAFWGFTRVLQELGDRKPPLILLENVPGFLSSRNGEDFASALTALNDLSYMADAFMVDASRFVPQSRQRLFIIGVLADETALDNRSIHESSPMSVRESLTRPKALVDFILNHPQIKWNVRDLPDPPERSKRIEDIIEDLPDDSSLWWNEERVQYLLHQMSPRHSEQVSQMMKGEEWTYGTVFRRMRHGQSMAELRTDGIAGCLRTPRGGSGRQIVIRAGKGSCWVRLLTPREAARLMGADDFQITVGLNQALFGFGDAVCVPVIEWIAQYYLTPLVNELLRGTVLGYERKESHYDLV